MPAVTITTVTTRVRTSTPTPSELRKFNEGECPICTLPTTTASDTTAAATTTTTTKSQPDSPTPSPPSSDTGTGPTQAIENNQTTETMETTEATATLEAAAKTPCGHMFHAACLESWIAVWRDIRRTVYASEPPKCPYCRTILLSIRHVHSTEGCTLDGLYKNILSTGVWNLTADPVGAPVFWSIASGGMDVDFYMYFAVEDEETDEEGDHDMDVLSLLEN
jgi:hypothetical protein